MISYKNGNIFTTTAETIVNTVNCVGIMGAGIAFEFRLREPSMYEQYRSLCAERQIAIGKLWLCSSNGQYGYKQVLNFPTKIDWKLPSDESYLRQGLDRFVATYQTKNISSIAFPMLGADRGGISQERSLSIMQNYLNKCDIDIEIWRFDTAAKDDLFDRFIKRIKQVDFALLKKECGIRSDILKKVIIGSEQDDINSISGLLRLNGVGDVSIEKLFHYVSKEYQRERSLFDIG
ncbi:hypothetical protein FACS189487_00340 [Campylobacterota bacterium]|nr:hypothetical protein FACS189487_00340 [Campylobacterota bacterium]